MIDIFPISLFLCFLLWVSNKYLKIDVLENIRKSPQTFHKKSTSRLGGLAVFFSLFFVVNFVDTTPNYDFLKVALLCSIPIFIVGFLDDLKVEISPSMRILLMIPTPLLFFFIMNVRVESVSITFIDELLSNEFFGLIFLTFSIIGIINAFNIIDGFNGLLLSYVITVLVSLIFGYQEGSGISSISYMVAIFFAVLGVFVFNFPFGKIFLGDAGAYLLGALVPLGLIKYTFDNNFSPWFVLALLIYPVTEVIVSIIRKSFFRKMSALKPDGLHLHMLIYKKVTKKIGFRRIRQRHFLVTLLIFIGNFPFMLLANLFKDNTANLVFLCMWYFLAYLAIYFILLPKYAFKVK